MAVDHDAVVARKPVEERPAGRSAVDDDDRPLDRGQPFRELDVGHVRPAQVELGLASVERAVSDQDDPERLRARRLAFSARIEFSRSRSVGPVCSDRPIMDRFGPGLVGGGLPAVGRLAELAGVFGGTRGTDDDDHARPIRRRRLPPRHRDKASNTFIGLSPRIAVSDVASEPDLARDLPVHARPLTRRRPHSAARQAMAIRK